MEPLERHIRSLRTRMLVSGALFSVAFLMLVSRNMTSSLESQEAMMVMLGLVLASMLMLPRGGMPARMPRPSNQDDLDVLEMHRSTIRGLGRAGTYVRLLYFVLLLLAVFVIPRLFGQA